MKNEIQSTIVVIQKGKDGGDPIIGRVKNNNSLGKIVFFKDLHEVELPDIGDEVEVYIVNEFEKFMHCVFFEDAIKNFVKPKTFQKEIEKVMDKLSDFIENIPDDVKIPQEIQYKNRFNKTVFELTDVEEVNNFLEGQAFKLVGNHVINNEIVYIVHRVV